MTYMILNDVGLMSNTFEKIFNLNNYLFWAFTISLVNAGVLGAVRPLMVFHFSSKNDSINQNETFTIAFLTKFLTNSWNKIFIGQFFCDL